MRAFLSVDLPDELATPFSKVQEVLQGAEGLNFTDPEQAHVTLKFLGKVPADDVDDVIDAVAAAVDEADVEPFETNVTGLGVFPSLDYISVVWVGVDGGAVELSALHEALEAATTDLGYAPEEHEFTPHFTLARMNDARGKDVVQDAVRNHNPEVGTFTIDEVRLKESHLTEDGPEYETVESFEL